MNEYFSQYQEDFSKLQSKTHVSKAKLAWYFDQESFGGEDYEEIPLSFYITDFDFLKELPLEERDLEILSYSIKAWNDVCLFGIKKRPEIEYICYLYFFEDEYREFRLLLPTLLFVKPLDKTSLFEHYSRTFKKPTSEFSQYIMNLIQKLPVEKNCIVSETSDPSKEGSIIVNIDFPSVENEKRIPLPTC